MPTFLGGSNLAVPVTSKQKALAADWIAAYTNTQNMTRMATAGGVIPNTTSLARINASKPKLAPFAEAAKYSWFVPSTPNWANVESANVLQSMLTGILRNPAKTQELATAASERITEILNARSCRHVREESAVPLVVEPALVPARRRRRGGQAGSRRPTSC